MGTEVNNMLVPRRKITQNLLTNSKIDHIMELCDVIDGLSQLVIVVAIVVAVLVVVVVVIAVVIDVAVVDVVGIVVVVIVIAVVIVVVVVVVVVVIDVDSRCRMQPGHPGISVRESSMFKQAGVEAEAEAGYGIESILRLTSRQSGRQF